jgi:DNA polymerase V
MLVAGAARRARLLAVLDGINGRWGRGTLRYLAEGGMGGQAGRMRRERLSPAYTTCWAEFPGVG